MPETKSDSESILAHWSRLSLRAKGVAGLSVPMTALFIAMLSIYWFEGNAPDADQTVMRAYDTRAEILQFQIFLLDAETSVSGYLATGDNRRLSSYRTARASTEQSLAKLAALVGGDPASASPLQQIQSSAREELDTLEQLQTRQAPAADRNRMLDRAKELIGEVQSRLSILNQAQDLRLFRARYNRDVERQQLFRIVVVCGIVGPLGSLFIHLILAGKLVRRLRLVEENARRLA